MVRRLKPNLLRCDVNLRVQVCLHLATEEKFRGQVILNRIVSPIYREFLTKILWRKMRKILKSLLHTNWCHALMSVTFWPRNSDAIFAGKIAQLCALVKSRIFYRRKPQILKLCISNVIFLYHVGLTFSLHRLRKLKFGNHYQLLLFSCSVCFGYNKVASLDDTLIF